MSAFIVYDELINAPSYLASFYNDYLNSASEIKTILDSSDTQAKLLIKEFFSNYSSDNYDDKVAFLYDSLKAIFNADGYSELKNELENVEESKKAQVQPLIDFINFVETTNDEIDTYLLMYELFKNKTLAGMLEGTVIEFEQEQKTKLDNIINKINEAANQTYSEGKKYATIVSIILTQYGDEVNTAKSLLESKVKTAIDKAKTQLDSGYSELSKGQHEYDVGLKKYYDGVTLLEENEELIKQAKLDVIEGKKKLEDGKEELEIAKNKVKDFDKKIEEIEHYDITLLGRNLNGGVASTTPPIDMMSSIKYTMVLLFIVVGVFVCYSALSRSVYDQTIQIGTKKALGLSRKEVTLSFLMYGSFATIIGCILGVGLARFIVEPIILNILAKNYIVSSNQYYFDLKSSLLFMLFELAVTNVTSFLACNKALMKKAIKLLQGPEDLIGKTHFYEKLPFWSSLSLLTKTIINNCVNDKRRVLSTLVGVAGCCSLMVCAISLITNMNESLDYQLNNIAKFESIAYVDSSIDGSLDKVNAKLDEMGIEHFAATYSSSALENSKGDFISGALFIYDDDKFFDFFEVATNGKRNEVGEGVCIAKAYAQYNDIKPGDTITVLDSLGIKQDIKVTTIFDYYLLRAQTVMTKDSYIDVYGKEP
ncbi:MAG: FtsX-like permease family protein, partial [Erysipelotrichaceae bacterium]|nr:FtsX-like permease family protein [Erysipelotrichaceae bacterium]